MDKKFYLYYTKKNKFEIRQYNIRGAWTGDWVQMMALAEANRRGTTGTRLDGNNINKYTCRIRRRKK